MSEPAWIPCVMCDDYVCTIHNMHVHDCPCPPIDFWGDISPYDSSEPYPGDYDYDQDD